MGFAKIHCWRAIAFTLSVVAAVGLCHLGCSERLPLFTGTHSCLHGRRGISASGADAVAT